MAWRPRARRLPPSQSLVIRRRPVLSVMVVASRPFDMVPDGLRAQSGQRFGGRGLLLRRARGSMGCLAPMLKLFP